MRSFRPRTSAARSAMFYEVNSVAVVAAGWWRAARAQARCDCCPKWSAMARLAEELLPEPKIRCTWQSIPAFASSLSCPDRNTWVAFARNHSRPIQTCPSQAWHWQAGSIGQVPTSGQARSAHIECAEECFGQQRSCSHFRLVRSA